MEYLNSIFTPFLTAVHIVGTVPMLSLIIVGNVLGLIVGILPGFGGVTALSVILPFIVGAQPETALIFMIAVQSVVNTGDTIPAILMGVPGTAGAAATVVDGYPMARRGEAGRALGASFSASALGGLFGALILLFTIPIARPLVLAAGSPHLFMLSILGISMVAVLSGKQMGKGIAAASLGLLVAAVGGVPGMAFVRYTFDVPSLEPGVPIVIVALGIFALPEIIDLVISRKQIAQTQDLTKGMFEGIKDSFKHWGVLLRGCIIGTIVGIIPGIGGSVADWVAYGQTVQFAKDRSMFGKGDVRGVIGPESSNNAKNGGDLIPTLLFGIPGSGSMAIFLVGLIMLGIYPGQKMVTENLHVVYYIWITLVISSLFGSLICLAWAKQIAKVTLIKIHYIAPVMVMLIVIGAFSATRAWQDLMLVLGVGIFGWFMKRYGWPRPALFIGSVLGNMAERYLSISIQRFGFTWLYDKGVIFLGVLMIVSLMYPYFRWGTKDVKPVVSKS